MSVLSSKKSNMAGNESVFLNKASFQIEQGSTVQVQFNPEQFKITRTAQYHHTSQKENEVSYIEYLGTAVPRLTIRFFFDTSGAKTISGKELETETDVTVLTEKFANLVQIKPELHRPPIVKFVWGSTCFEGFVEQVLTTYTMFNQNGMPIRAKVDATMIGIPENTEERIPLESPDRTKSRVVSDETSIWTLAANEYDDISKWRVIAKANGIMNPFDIPSGTVLKVPALKE